LVWNSSMDRAKDSGRIPVSKYALIWSNRDVSNPALYVKNPVELSP
jgi:hypothetical protein